jgi:hypothetical protein
MLSDLLWLMGAFFAAALVYRFRTRIFGILARFDAKNAARQAEEAWEKRDRFAHYRRAVLTAEESLEEVSQVSVIDDRTGEPVNRYLFLGRHYATMNEAALARRGRAIEIAREFYAELDGRSGIRTRRPDTGTPQLPPN